MCECKKLKKGHNEWFKNLLKEKAEKKKQTRTTTKPMKKRKGMSTGGFKSKLEKL